MREAVRPPVAIPGDVSQVDAAWLTQALQGAFPGVVVERADVVQNFGGASTKLRVALRTSLPEVPPSVVVKGCLEPHSRIMREVQLREIRSYTGYVAGLDVETIRVFFGGIDEGGWGALVMEDLDLRGVTCLRALDPIATFDLAAAFLDEIAGVHARFWDSPDLADGGPMSWLPGPNDPFQPRFAAILQDEAQFAEKLASPRLQATPAHLRDRHRILAAFRKVFSNPHGFPLTVGHGDLHLANLFLSGEGRPGFLDWNARRSPWAQDVNYFIVCCLDPVDRRRWEQPLLQRYRDRLAACGVVPPSWEQAWLAYRQYSVWGAVVWFLNRTDFHSETVITALAHRFGAAMTDHDCFGLLGV